jgi:hypothetical protein
MEAGPCGRQISISDKLAQFIRQHCEKKQLLREYHNLHPRCVPA